MEIRKSGSSVLNVNQENSTTETEKKSEKSLARGIASAKDSFEVSSSSNQENSGKKELGASQQQEASKMNYKDFGNNGTASQDSRTRYEDAKNSGLVAHLGHAKQESDPKAERLPKGTTVEDIKSFNSPIGSEQTSDAVKDAQQKLGGGRYSREALDQELAQRRSDYSMFGGSSPMDRLRNSTPDPTAAPKGKNEVPTGKDQVAYGEVSERKNKDGSVTTMYDEVTSKDGKTFQNHGETTVKPDRTMVVENKATSFSSNYKYEQDSKKFYDAQLNLTKETQTDTAYASGKQLATATTTTTYNKDGSTTTTTTTKETKEDGSTTTTTTKETTKPAGGEKSPSYGYDGSPGSSYGYMPLPPGVDDDRAGGDIPDYVLNQINETKPKKGGETELTDGGVTGNSADGSGPVDNAFTRTGGVMGAVAQPTRAGEYVGGPSNGTVGSAIQNGGATDPIDGNNWTGTTHQDDPADVQFGPADQPKEQGNKKTEESEDSSKSVFDLLRNQKSK